MPNDYFAELYVAGSMAKAGWNVYFPHRDKGFDFIISKLIGGKRWVVRPVQVKSKTPRNESHSSQLRLQRQAYCRSDDLRGEINSAGRCACRWSREIQFPEMILLDSRTKHA